MSRMEFSEGGEYLCPLSRIEVLTDIQGHT